MPKLARSLTSAIALLAAFAGCSDTSGITEPDVLPETATKGASPSLTQGARPIGVMSRNVYLGADTQPILTASTPAAIPGLVGQAWASVLASNFPERAVLLAREIAHARPDVIGLQEVALFRIQSPGDFLVGNPQVAEDVAFDYLQIIMDALASRGLDYVVATSIENVDVELPAATSPTTFIDVRFTDRDVVLVRSDVQVESAVSGHYVTNLSLPVAGAFPLTEYRGWNRVELTHRGTSYTFVNTHLETDDAGPAIQEIQAQELAGMVEGVEGPTIIVGDLNGISMGGPATYATMTGAGFDDLWQNPGRANGHPGFTCCFDHDLQGGDLFERIDYVLARVDGRQRPHVASMSVVGDEPFATTPSGLRASDHAGVVAGITFPPPAFAASVGR